ncbi:hypothetical protein DP20_4512 [Shigella flexneri]|nr:hypothetical protein DP20_4512 [Shigella flexneri]
MASISIRCPSCSATEGVVRNGKALPDISAISALIAVNMATTVHLHRLSARYAPEIIDMAMNGVGCRASARIMGVGLNTVLRHLKTQAAVGNLAHTTGQ